MIDSLKLFETLKTGDLPDPQARAIVQAIESALKGDAAQQAKVLAGKIDAAKLDEEIHQVETSLKQDLFTLGVEFRSELRETAAQSRSELRETGAQLRSELKTELAQLEGRMDVKIAKSESTLIRWMFIFWIGQVAAMKFLK